MKPLSRPPRTAAGAHLTVRRIMRLTERCLARLVVRCAAHPVLRCLARLTARPATLRVKALAPLSAPLLAPLSAPLIAACALLCGGLAEATMAAAASAPTAPPRATAPAGTVLIEAYGDSTTLGTSCSNGRCGPLAQNAVTWLQDALQDDFGTRVVVSNLGVGGSMASQLLDGVCHGRCPPFAARMAVSSAQIVTFNYGINEVMQNQTPEQFYAAETALVKAARAAGKEPLLETSNPMPDRRLNAKLAAMVEMTRRVALEQHVPLVDQYAYISSLPNWQAQMSDGAHPKPELYQLKARASYAVLDPLVRRRLHGAS